MSQPLEPAPLQPLIFLPDGRMPEAGWLGQAGSAFRLMIATSWLAPEPLKGAQEEAIRQACGDRPDWDDYVWLVDRHRTPAVSWAAIKRVPGVNIPERVAQLLRSRSDVCRMKAMLHLQTLASVLREFNRNSIPAMPLKGPLLSLDLYGDPGLRQAKDLDIMIAGEHICRAQECLEAIGWRRGAGYVPLSPRQAKFYRQYEHHFAYIHPQRGCVLELHWRTDWDTPSMAADRLRRAAPATWQGCSYLAMDPLDQALYLCNHGSAHAWLRAKWLGDLVRLVTVKPMDWNFTLARAHAIGQERPLLICLRILKDFYGLTTSETIDRCLNALPKSLTGKAIRELTSRMEPEARSVPTRLMEQLRSYGYKRRLWPYKSRWETYVTLAIVSVDFKTLRLPDWIFWLYIPLRPFLWVKRRLWDSVRARKNSATGTSST